MIVLGIETATRICGVGLADEEGCIAEVRIRGGNLHGERLGHAVAALLRDAGILPAQIDGAAVSIGPGSYTGLRIGLAFAKGFVWAQNKPLAAVPTLDAMAMSVPVAFPLLCVLLRSAKDEAYQGIFHGEDDRWVASGPAAVVEKKDAGRECSGKETVFIGEGAALYEKDIRRNAEHARFLPHAFSLPSGFAVASKGRELLLAGRRSEPGSLVPRYLKRFQGVE
jgi:tRNA threonylcarbamoyladenosine biosynthesis protein TsaB